MKYSESSCLKHWFLITPDELKQIVEGYHLVTYSTGVASDYKESSVHAYIEKYGELYDFLCSGQKAVYERDYRLFNLETGITNHLENISYVPSSGLSIPDFSEPCVTMGAFCVMPFGDMPITKGWLLGMNPENTIGLVIRFPSKAIYENDQSSRKANELKDYETWNELKKRIRSITKPLKIRSNGRDYNPQIRVSPQSQKDLQTFYVCKSLGFDIV